MSPAKTPTDSLNYVDFFRHCSPYINAQRGKTLVLMLDGEALLEGSFNNIANDLALLNSLGLRLVLVHGGRPQIEARLAQDGIVTRQHCDLRITDSTTLACVKQVIGGLRTDIEARLSMGLPNSPMHGAKLRVCSGNFVAAKPLGVVEGVDYHLNDPSLLEQATQSKAFALVMPPVGNLSNRFYAVHPRRNDRFVTARPDLKALFPEVDFATMAFTGHVLSTLAATCPERYAEVRRAITTAWVSRMQGLLRSLPSQGALIDLPTPSWQQRPLIPSEGRRRVFIDTDDRAAGAETLRAALVTRSA